MSDDLKLVMSNAASDALKWHDELEAARKTVYEFDFASWGDPTRLSYWFPIVQAIGIRVPKTIIVLNPLPMGCIHDGIKPAHMDELVRRISQAGRAVAGDNPFFLRTEYTSNKHSWKTSCFVTDHAAIPRHVCELVGFSGCVDIPHDHFVVREILHTYPLFTAFHGEMPIAREFRLFVKDGSVYHIQPYWPREAIEQHADTVSRPDYAKVLADASILSERDKRDLVHMTQLINQHLPGDWSVDWLETTAGWYMTDMAVGPRSYKYDPLSGKELNG
jgi:hypothetical protein